ncbi:hypothetical protein [Lysobacter gummosus]|uniref:hypothetical protein n=1 Tax=Lysobacter gummosus TaxID=262324 RepID=UPI00363BBB71
MNSSARPLFIARHSREGGNPGLHRGMTLKSLDSRLRGNDEQKRTRAMCKQAIPKAIPNKKGPACRPSPFLRTALAYSMKLTRPSAHCAPARSR